jgi:integrase
MRRHFRALDLPADGVKSVHGFRALYAGRLRTAGVDLATIQGLLGQSRIEVTQLYFPNEPERGRVAVEALPSFAGKMLETDSEKF